jgi:hypothetical protein
MMARKHRAINRRLDLPEIKSYAPGIYARSETLVQATRDLDRGRTTEAAVQDQREADLRSFLDAQREAGLDYLSDGLLNWQDIFRPFDEAARGLEPGPLKRSLNTNTFYRAPVVIEEAPRLVEPLGEPYFRIGDLPRNRWVVTLPSPHALAEFAAGELESRAVAEGVLGASDQVARGERLRGSRAAGDGALRWRDRRLSLERRARHSAKPAAGCVAASVR